MQDHPSPVPIRWIAIATEPGEVAILNSVADLGTTLLARWPDDQRGDLWRGAVSACLRALDAQINGNAPAKRLSLLPGMHMFR
jgi:hypothetical protein